MAAMSPRTIATIQAARTRRPRPDWSVGFGAAGWPSWTGREGSTRPVLVCRIRADSLATLNPPRSRSLPIRSLPVYSRPPSRCHAPPLGRPECVPGERPCHTAVDARHDQPIQSEGGLLTVVLRIEEIHRLKEGDGRALAGLTARLSL